VLLPDTPAFSTDGHLRATFQGRTACAFAYRDFNGRIGESDIHGSLTYTTGKPRPKLEGDVASQQLRLADLGPLIGVNAGTKAPQASSVRRPAAACGKVLPYDRFETDKWNVMDADVRFKGGKLSMAARCRSATSRPISSSKMPTCACSRCVWPGGRDDFRRHPPAGR
jgi:uncharacterized protein involved in outer membrane biogenesis